jgi:hypothetical protein
VTTEFHHPFDPSLRPSFSPDAYLAAQPYRGLDCRELFHTLMHLSEHYAVYPVVYDFIRQHLAAVGFQDADSLSDSTGREPVSTGPAALPLPSNAPPLTDEELGNRLRQLSPVILTEPDWLNSVSQTATSQNPLAVDLMAVYLKLTRRETGRGLFLGLLPAAGREVLPLTSRAFAQQEAIGACPFELACIQLAFTCFPRVFFPEILGFTQAYCHSSDLLDIFRSSNGNPSLDRFLEIHQSQKRSVIPDLNQIIDGYVHTFKDREVELRCRIRSGFRLYRTQAERCRHYLLQQALEPPSFGRQWATLLEKKAAAAAGHHDRIKVGGRSLNDWFAESPFDSIGFVSELAKSPYINKENPSESPLLKLFDFNGRMFGVLTHDEKKILEHWLISEKAEIPEALSGTGQTEPAIRAEDEQAGPKIDFSKLGNRELYYYLVNAELFPEVMTAARQKVRKVLRSAGYFHRLPFRAYSHRAFEELIAALYRHETERYRPLDSAPKLSREAYLWGIEQFAPAILADGCWLQAVNQMNSGSNRAFTALLFKIYEDEAGNGKLEQNHPFIYRQLLDSVDLDLPPITSREFVGHPGFIDSAFDLPVYLLSISKFPSAFLPELLGLNMAIELNGLGNVYLRLSEELAYWGLNPDIVDVHISIDNVSSGHAFLAQEAIQLYLDEIMAVSGVEAVNSHWRRIHNGYCSLQSACRGFKFALVWCYLLKRIKK